jgi:hypothetical protein
VQYRPPRLVRVLAPLCALAGAACLYFAFEIGIAEPLNLGGGQFFIPEPAMSGRPLAVIRAVEPRLFTTGWVLLAVSAVLWVWDTATGN